MTEHLDPSTPVLVGVGAAQRHDGNPTDAHDVIGLMEAACRAADADAGGGTMALVDDICVPRGLWQYRDPGRLVAERVGAMKARTCSAEIGILQQAAISRACDLVTAGDARAALVLGGETRWREQQALRAGVELTDTREPADARPDVELHPDGELWWDAEADRGLLMPVHHYAVCEQALRISDGSTLAELDEQLARHSQVFSEVADTNPWAWPGRTAPADKAAFLSSPYRRHHPSQWNVDQAAALLITTVGHARSAGISSDRWVFPMAGTEANLLVPVSARAEMGRSPGFEAAFSTAFEHAGIGVDDLDHIDCYSCFPIAVRVQARALGIPDGDARRPLTVTGGMSFGGGPLNNYVLQAMVRLAELLRESGGKGVSTSVSGMLNKQGVGLWSATPPDRAYATIDVTPQTEATTELRQLDAGATGPATVASWTVLHRKGEPERLIAVCDTPSGSRAIAASTDPDELQNGLAADLAGTDVILDAAGGLHLA